MPTPSLAYQTFVAKYLASEAGRDTPDSVARALLVLDPVVCGFDRRPCVLRLHVFRELIQDVHADAADGLTMSAAQSLDESGAVPTSTLVVRLGGSTKAG